MNLNTGNEIHELVISRYSNGEQAYYENDSGNKNTPLDGGVFIWGLV